MQAGGRLLVLPGPDSAFIAIQCVGTKACIRTKWNRAFPLIGGLAGLHDSFVPHPSCTPTLLCSPFMPDFQADFDGHDDSLLRVPPAP